MNHNNWKMPAAFTTFLTLLLNACTSNEGTLNADSNPLSKQYAQVWLTQGDKSVLFQHDSIPIVSPSQAGWPQVKVDTAIQYQEVEGYGAALTGSSAYLFHHSLDPTQRQRILKELFDPHQGIGLSYLRLTMGASDFSLSDYTYNDLPGGETDFNLEHFSLSRDTDDVVPILKEIIALYPDIKFMGTPWSPPAWMKTSQNLRGGQLKPECYPVYARYFVKYIQAMQNKGIRIDAITPQNEPLHATAGYPCMLMQPDEQKAFIRDHLGPAFRSAGIDTKIVIYDHNWDRADYATSVLSDPNAAQYIAGSAFHAYGGDVSAMSIVHNAFPDKKLYFTEISGGEWAVNFGDNLMWYMKNILIGTVLNWSSNALFWNLALDQNHGPRNNGCQDCRGVITISGGGGTITRNEEYYALAHFAKFVRPGALRIHTNPDPSISNVDFVVFRNTDGSKAMVIANYNIVSKTFAIVQANKAMNYTLPARSTITVVWY